ncbi:uncharacterized protein LOC102800479 [Saccoglossus kowalevskii]|uniref:Uncharacterized protein LOC102800479 n=1 Tax=Saccoglossus kowalevskii TaxID=10224 RepID=A0ABM0MEU5_SACKO|nr:PREDICTED: uncharacterized protein LOC102800479 [Saccoglossus kowalevskii]
MLSIQSVASRGKLFTLGLITLNLSICSSAGTAFTCFEIGDIFNITCPFETSQSVTLQSVRWSVDGVNSLIAHQLLGDEKEQNVVGDNNIINGPLSLTVNTTGMKEDINYVCTVTYLNGNHSQQQMCHVELHTCDSLSTQSLASANHTTIWDVQNSTQKYIEMLSYILGAILIVVVFTIVAIVVYCRRKRTEVNDPSYTAITRVSSNTTEA